MSERSEQAALIQWADWQGRVIPEAGLLFAIPNGQARPGQPLEPGLRKGVPDLFLPVPRGQYHGLFIELKYGRNRPSPEQAEWMVRLSQQGYRTAVCYGWMDAKDVILNYLSSQ
jgi:hypothetical protein